MRFHRLNFYIASLTGLVLIWSSLAIAAGGGGEAPEPTLSKDQKEFVEKSSKLTTLTNKISEAEKQFAELVHHKNASKDTAEKQRYIHEMIALAEQRNKDVDAYNKLKSDLALRYPNQGERLNRRYHTQSKRSVKELEGVAGLDEFLTHTKKVVMKKFESFNKEESKAPPTRKPAQHSDGQEEVKRLRLEK